MIECDTLSTRTVASISVTGEIFQIKWVMNTAFMTYWRGTGRAGAGGGGRGPG